MRALKGSLRANAGGEGPATSADENDARRPNSTGTVSGIRYEDMVFKSVYWPLQLLGHYCPFPCKQADGNSSTLFANISFVRVSGSTSQRSILPGTETTVSEFMCSSYTPCTNITLEAVTLTDKAGRAGKLRCENVTDVHIDNASSPSGCALLYVETKPRPLIRRTITITNTERRNSTVTLSSDRDTTVAR